MGAEHHYLALLSPMGHRRVVLENKKTWVFLPLLIILITLITYRYLSFVLLLPLRCCFTVGDGCQGPRNICSRGECVCMWIALFGPLLTKIPWLCTQTQQCVVVFGSQADCTVCAQCYKTFPLRPLAPPSQQTARLTMSSTTHLYANTMIEHLITNLVSFVNLRSWSGEARMLWLKRPLCMLHWMCWPCAHAGVGLYMSIYAVCVHQTFV